MMGLLVPKRPSYAYTTKGDRSLSTINAPSNHAPINALRAIRSRIIPDKFAWDDLAQQIVGAMILSAPLAVTEEVWRLSGGLDWTRIGLIVVVTLIFNILLLYYAKYQIVEQERIFGIIPTRLLSLMLVSYITAFVMLYLMGVIGGTVVGTGSTIRLVVFVGILANIGAGAAALVK